MPLAVLLAYLALAFLSGVAVGAVSLFLFLWFYGRTSEEITDEFEHKLKTGKDI